MSTSVVERLRAAGPTVSVGVISADLLRLGEEIAELDCAGTALLHFDVMDGCFCPMTTIGPPFIQAVRTRLLKDVHLMITEPTTKVGQYVAAGADVITVHVESGRHLHRALQLIGELDNANEAGRGIARGVALNPGTPVQAIESLLEQIDIVTLLAVNPGFGGQRFTWETPRRLERLRALLAHHDCHAMVCIDGGVTLENIDEVAALRPDVVVSGSAVFSGAGPAVNIPRMLESLQRHADGR